MDNDMFQAWCRLMYKDGAMFSGSDRNRCGLWRVHNFDGQSPTCGERIFYTGDKWFFRDLFQITDFQVGPDKCDDDKAEIFLVLKEMHTPGSLFYWNLAATALLKHYRAPIELIAATNENVRPLIAQALAGVANQSIDPRLMPAMVLDAFAKQEAQVWSQFNEVSTDEANASDYMTPFIAAATALDAFWSTAGMPSRVEFTAKMTEDAFMRENKFAPHHATKASIAFAIQSSVNPEKNETIAKAKGNAQLASFVAYAEQALAKSRGRLYHGDPFAGVFLQVEIDLAKQVLDGTFPDPLALAKSLLAQAEQECDGE